MGFALCLYVLSHYTIRQREQKTIPEPFSPLSYVLEVNQILNLRLNLTTFTYKYRKFSKVSLEYDQCSMTDEIFQETSMPDHLCLLVERCRLQLPQSFTFFFVFIFNCKARTLLNAFNVVIHCSLANVPLRLIFNIIFLPFLYLYV